jgi:hypothetical protein
MQRDAFGRATTPGTGAQTPDADRASAVPSLPASAADGWTWWFWVRPRLLTTRFELGDDTGEWVADFDRRGRGGRRAVASDGVRDDIELRLGAGEAEPAASYDGRERVRIDGGHLAVGGRLLDIRLPRDGAFVCDVRDRDEPLLTVRRAVRGPFARLDVAAALPEPTLVALLMTFVLTHDHDVVHTMPSGGDGGP